METWSGIRVESARDRVTSAPGASAEGVGGPVELEEVVSGADERPLSADCAEAPDEEAPEGACVFDLPVHRLHDRLAPSIDRPPLGAPELVSHTVLGRERGVHRWY